MADGVEENVNVTDSDSACRHFVSRTDSFGDGRVTKEVHFHSTKASTERRVKGVASRVW